MQLDYPQKANGMYVLRNEDMDEIARAVFQTYAPHVLRYPCPVDIVDLAENAFNLTIESRNLSLNNEILGLTAFNDIEYPCYNQDLIPEVVALPYGTVVINKGLILYNQKARKRFTLAHENSHWILHRSYHSPTNQQFQLRKQMPGYIACRSSQVESNHHMLRSDKDWEEWQADSLAAALLMPKEVFIEAARDELGLGLNCYRGQTNSFQYYESIARLASRFQVSKNAACIRLKQLGLVRSIA